LIGCGGVAAVGKTPKLVHVAPLGGELDELVGGICVPAVSKTLQFIHIAALSSEFDHLVDRLPVSILGPFSQVGQVGFSHDAPSGGLGLAVLVCVSVRYLPGVGGVPDARWYWLCAVDQVIDRSGYCVRSGHRDCEMGGVVDGSVFCSGRPIFRAYSPQIADFSRRQPDSPANNSRVHYFAPRRRDPMPQTRAIMVEIAHQLNSPSAKVDILPAWP